MARDGWEPMNSHEHYDAAMELAEAAGEQVWTDARGTSLDGLHEAATEHLLAAIYLELRRSNDLAQGAVQGDRGETLVPRCQAADVRAGEVFAQCGLPAGHDGGHEDVHGRPVHPTRKGE
ncbi:hypothetical protein [Prauserella rugosa]|uniref:Uncharacterized protein n=1 Tax=Prauserella rugosa TaxID=43354 RepID=A0A660CCA9_9PSEU|nr:hypothetical protein [Prauserella rugosa]KMS86159.1 hypothetical protein ACZ91_38340 [Streptomyces regensis]TWH18551.1 hypothetical protein JD82_00370 [Prauserella rugosa]